MGNFWITGIEVVQAVQTPDNSVPLIGFKTTFVRVYVQADMNLGFRVTGILTIDTPQPWSRNILPVNQSIEVSVDGNHREIMDDSLLFQLDRDLTAEGERDIEVRIYSVLDDPHPPMYLTNRYVK
jgi:hypothetical protein